MVSEKKSNSVKDYIERLKQLQNGKCFYAGNKSQELADELEELLLELDELNEQTEEKIELLKLFFETDNKIVERCDDSNGYVGNVFRTLATDLFCNYAKACEDKDWLSQTFFKLIVRNDYGLRDNLLLQISSYLPPHNIEFIVDKLWMLYRKNKRGERVSSSELVLIQELAKTLKDPALFEKALREEGGRNIDFDNFRMGEMYFTCEQYGEAILSFEAVSSSWRKYFKCEKKLLLAYRKVGESEKAQEFSLKVFRQERNKENFEIFLKEHFHKDSKEPLINEIRIIFDEDGFNIMNVDFLIQMNSFDEVENYLLSRKNFLDGRNYESFIDWGELLEEKGKLIAATVLYRSLLDSILKSANTRAYGHGVRYLKKLESMANKIIEWKEISNHEKYLGMLKEAHSKKHSFWEKYEF